jgi:hypothetical protein
MTFPSQITAGDTLTFTTTLADYSAADGWVLSHVLIPRTSGSDVLTFDATADGSDFDSTVAAVTTADWTAGIYTWAAYVSKAGERFTVARGTTEVLANPADTEGGYDPRTHARKALDAINAAIEGRATHVHREYEIRVNESWRRVLDTTYEDLIKAKTYYEGLVASETAAEDTAAGRYDRRRTYVRFGRL